jgi:ATP-binding cassette, subfamily B, bacterial
MLNTNKALAKTFFPFMGYFLREYKLAVFLYTVLSLAAGFWGPLNSILLKQLINLLPQVAGGDIQVLILPASLLVLNFIVFDNFTWRGIGYIKYRFLPCLLQAVDSTLLNYTLQHSYAFFQERMAGSLSKQVFHVIDGVEKIVASSASNLLRAASLLLVAFVFAYQVNPIFLCILGLWSVSFFSVSLIMSKKLTALSHEQAAKASILGGQIIDSLSHALSVSLFARRAHEISRRAGSLADYRKAYQETEKYGLIMHSIQGGLIAIMMAFSAYFLVYLYAKGLVTVGDFALILGLSMETGHMMWFTMSQVDELNKVLGRCNQALASLILPLEIQDKPNASTASFPQGEITFDKVTFHYKGTEPLFQNKSIEIGARQKVGLVGYSGGGKSTFVNLILRLYDVTSGAILIDGQDIRDLTQDSLRSNIAMIPQDPALFHRSLAENIRYGCLDASDEELIQAAKKAHAHDFIEKLPQGYETVVGERGVRLSGGQRQRIAIARAILKNAPILILDEASSQLDSLTETLIQDSLWDCMSHKTTIVIAHRLSTLLHMDRILVFDKGDIIEDGSHSQLLSNNGLYKRLWDTQVGGFISDVA